MLRFALALLTVTTTIAAVHTLTEPSENPDPKLTAIAKKCCPESAFECCYKTLDFHTRLNCDKIPEGTLNTTIRCMQSEMHGEADVERASINHAGCCKVYENDQTDDGDSCLAMCNLALASPALNSKAKLHYIKHCREKNELSQCFNLCRIEQNEHVAQGFPVREFKFVEPDTCGLYKIGPEGLYGERLMRRF